MHSTTHTMPHNPAAKSLGPWARSLSILLVALALGANPSRADDRLTSQAISQAFRENSATKLRDWLAKTVDLDILETHDTYGKSQAVVVLQKFMDKHPCVRIVMVHETQVPNSRAIIGELTCGTGKYRLYLTIEGEGKAARIVQITISQALDK